MEALGTGDAVDAHASASLLRHVHFSSRVVATAQSLERRLVFNEALVERVLASCLLLGQDMQSAAGQDDESKRLADHPPRGESPTPSPMQLLPHSPSPQSKQQPRGPSVERDDVPAAACHPLALTAPFDRRWVDAVMNLELPADETARGWQLRGGWRSMHSTCWVLQCAPGKGTGACHRLAVWLGDDDVLRVALTLASDN